MATPKAIQYRKNITPDGRDLTHEKWRTIPDFPLYQITQDGDIRHRESCRILWEIENKKTGVYYYSLWQARRNGDMSVKNRTYLRLLYSAWPELLRDWKQIPGHPSYLVNRQGEVMGTRLYRILEPERGGYVRFKENNVRTYWRPKDLGDWDAFWADEKIAA